MTITLDAIRGEVAAWARGEPLVRAVWLFGSRARGDHRPDSDLDLAVLHGVDPEVRRQGAKGLASRLDLTWTDHRARWSRDLAARIPERVHLVPLQPGCDVRPHVKRDGVLLYRQRR